MSAPQRRYKGALTDSNVWRHVSLRPGDVIVTTPPKCGTTWMQALVSAVLSGTPGASYDIGGLSAWVDAGFRDPSALLAAIEAAPGRRCLKSHTPLDGLPRAQEIAYVAVYRHPIDAYFSFRGHMANLKPGVLQTVRSAFSGDETEDFLRFVEREDPSGGADAFTLSGIVAHYRAVRDAGGAANLHVAHYADLSAAPEAETRRLADALGCLRDPGEIAAIAQGSSFGEMRARAARDGSGMRALVDPAAFFAEGTSGKWRGRLGSEALSAYARRIATLLPPEDVAWLENGCGRLA